MDSQMMTGNLAAAWGARLADVDYIPAFPITPQTEIVEALAKWCERGELAAKFVSMDSEHSMMTAAGAAEVAPPAHPATAARPGALMRILSGAAHLPATTTRAPGEARTTPPGT